MSCQYENLSNAELIKLLYSTRAELDKSNKKASLAQKKLDKADKTITHLKKKIDNAELKIKALEITNQSVYFIASNFTQEAHAIMHEIDRNFCICTEDDFSQDVLETFKKLFAQSLTCVKNYKIAFSQGPYGSKGSDIGHIPPASDTGSKDTESIEKKINDLKNSMENLNGSLKNQAHLFKQIKNSLHNVREYCVKHGITEDITRIDSILDTLKMKARHSNKNRPAGDKKSRGRQKTKNLDNAQTTVSDGKAESCDSCGGHDLKDFGKHCEKIISNTQNLMEAVKSLSYEYEIKLCTDCGRIVICFNKSKDDFPVSPNREISLSVALNTCLFMYNGVPEARYSNWLSEKFQLGNDTLSYNVSDYVSIYIDPLYKIIYTRAKALPVLLADETVFDCLQSQGKGNMSKEMKELRDKGELATNSKNYILTLASPSTSDTKLVYFRYINSRSTESLCDVITDDFEFKYLVSDAYSAYKTICSRREGRKWQTCMIHFRREVIKACNPKVYAQDLQRLNEQELTEKILNDFNVKGIKAPGAMLEIFFAISKIYQIESAYQYDGSMNIETYRRNKQDNREQIKLIFNKIDTAVNSIKDQYVEQTKTGTYRAKSKGNLYAKPLIYYLNHRSHFTTFLENADISPDSNHVESMIRKMAMIRSSVKQKVNPNYMQDLCKIVTVFKTLELNGINAETYLKELTNTMYVHCLSKGLTQYYRENGELPKKQIKSWDMVKLLEDFDYSKFPIFKD